MRKIILRLLANCPRDLGMRKSTLAHELTVAMEREIGDGDLTAELLKLKAGGWISTTTDAVTGDTIYIATDKARATLR